MSSASAPDAASWLRSRTVASTTGTTNAGRTPSDLLGDASSSSGESPPPAAAEPSWQITPIAFSESVYRTCLLCNCPRKKHGSVRKALAAAKDHAREKHQ